MMPPPTPKPATGSNITPPGRARLLLQSQAPELSSLQETDARGGLMRGLREYLLGLVWDAVGGRQIKFQRVLEGYAEPEQLAKYPSAVVYGAAPGEYEAASLTPALNPACRLPAPDGRYVIVPAVLSQEIQLEVWTNDPAERMQATALLEQALNPVIYRYGFQLLLPFYFGQIATYSLNNLVYQDSDDEAAKRYRIAKFSLTGTVPVTKLVAVANAKPFFDLRSVGTNIDVLFKFEVE